jgi:hypothetical protein
MLSFAASYWCTLNVSFYPSSTPITLLFYVAMVFLYFIYVIFLENVGVYTFALGSLFFGMITGMGWAQIIKTYISVAGSDTDGQGTAEDQIIDISSSKDVKCTAFRL